MGSGKTSLIKRVYTNLTDLKSDKNLKVVCFDAFRLSPMFWNVDIIAGMVVYIYEECPIQ